MADCPDKPAEALGPNQTDIPAAAAVSASEAEALPEFQADAWNKWPCNVPDETECAVEYRKKERVIRTWWIRRVSRWWKQNKKGELLLIPKKKEGRFDDLRIRAWELPKESEPSWYAQARPLAERITELEGIIQASYDKDAVKDARRRLSEARKKLAVLAAENLRARK